MHYIESWLGPDLKTNKKPLWNQVHQEQLWKLSVDWIVDKWKLFENLLYNEVSLLLEGKYHKDKNTMFITPLSNEFKKGIYTENTVKY